MLVDHVWQHCEPALLARHCILVPHRAWVPPRASVRMHRIQRVDVANVRPSMHGVIKNCTHIRVLWHAIVRLNVEEADCCLSRYCRAVLGTRFEIFGVSSRGSLLPTPRGHWGGCADPPSKGISAHPSSDRRNQTKRMSHQCAHRQ